MRYWWLGAWIYIWPKDAWIIDAHFFLPWIWFPECEAEPEHGTSQLLSFSKFAHSLWPWFCMGARLFSPLNYYFFSWYVCPLPCWEEILSSTWSHKYLPLTNIFEVVCPGWVAFPINMNLGLLVYRHEASREWELGARMWKKKLNYL